MVTQTKPQIMKLGNRKINRPHVENIKESILKNGYLRQKPILTDKFGNIIDGQHRYIACEELGVVPEIQVLDGDVHELMIDLNTTQKSWTLDDYINYYAQKGYDSYIWLQEFCAKFQVSPTIALIVMQKTSGGNQIPVVRKGQLKIDENYLETAEYNLETIRYISKTLKLNMNRSFTSGIIQLSKEEGFDWGVLLDKVAKYRDQAYQCTSSTSYQNMFRNLYNYQTRSSSRRL